MKIALGTAQFGMSYGVANSSGVVAMDTAQRVIEFARGAGIDTIDTAAAYGESEKKLGCIGVNDFKVVTKLAKPEGLDCATNDWLEQQVSSSLNKLRLRSLYGLLVHRPQSLLAPDGQKLYEGLIDLKRRGVTHKIGVSIYDPSELEMLQELKFDIVQAPLNILDQRLKHSGWLEKLSSQGVEVHTRSAFLQGLLLMAPKHRPKYFDRWKSILEKYDAWIVERKLTPVQACVRFLSSIREIDKIIVGFETFEQLNEVVKATAGDQDYGCAKEISSDNIELIDPRVWKL